MGLYFALGLVGIAVDFYVAVKFKKIAEDKGYDSMEYFFVCFFLTFIGYIMVAALPDRKKVEMPVYNRDTEAEYVRNAKPARAAAAVADAAPVQSKTEEPQKEVSQPVAGVQQAAPVQQGASPAVEALQEVGVNAENPPQTETNVLPDTQAEADPKPQPAMNTPVVPVSPQISIAPDFELPVPEFVKRQEEAKAAEAAKTPEEIAAEEAARKAAEEEAARIAAEEAARKAAEEEAARIAEEERHRGVGRAPFKPEVHPEVSIDSPQAQLDKFGELPDL